MDQVSRDDDLLDQLADVRWDVGIVDEVHRMSARNYGTDLKKTKRLPGGPTLNAMVRNTTLRGIIISIRSTQEIT